jgi:hypothetical protein
MISSQLKINFFSFTDRRWRTGFIHVQSQEDLKPVTIHPEEPFI